MKEHKFAIGQLVKFQLPVGEGWNKYEGYVSALPVTSDPYNRYTIKAFDGTWGTKELGENLLHKHQIFGCTTYNELLSVMA